MLSEGTRRFDLYDFFSVLIPGGTFVIGILPFFPEDTPVFSTGIIIILVLLGFVFGRALHALGLLLEGPVSESRFLSIAGYTIADLGVATGHRYAFIRALQNPDPNDVSKSLADEFYRTSTAFFSGIDLPDTRSALDESDEDELETLYTLVRSHIHIDARGRSRTFQAVLDFQRTMMMTSLVLFFIYTAYAVVKNNIPADVIDYQTYIGDLDIAWWLIFIIAIMILIGSYTTFERIRSSYRRYFIQYLMSDFITLYSSSSETQRPVRAS